MPQPTLSDVHVNAPLTAISIAFRNSMETVADKAFPVVPVSKSSDRYFVYNKGDWTRDDAKKRAPSTESAGSGWSIDNTQSYSCDVFALHKDIDDQIRANADAPLDMDRDGTIFVTQKLALRQEKQWAQDFFATSTWTGSTTAGDITPGTLWDVAGSTPIKDIRAQITSVAKKTGYRPNTMVMSPAVYNALCDHADFTDRIKYGQTPGAPAIIDASDIAAVLKLERVLVGWMMETTSVEGATETQDFVLGNDALLCYAAPSPSILAPSAGYTFRWSGLMGSMGMGARVKKFRMEHLASDRIEGEDAFDHKVVAAQMGAFFLNPVS